MVAAAESDGPEVPSRLTTYGRRGVMTSDDKGGVSDGGARVSRRIVALEGPKLRSPTCHQACHQT